jgi:pimeloyl-ACP methyl ester carboxylesterase
MYTVIVTAIVLISVTMILLLVRFHYFRKALTERLTYLDSIPSKVFSSSYGDIEYLLKGTGPTILVSHGVTGGIDQGMGMAEDFIDSEYQLLLISRFGYLKSSIPGNPTAALQADVYCELLNHLGIDEVFILGNSAGGTSALQFAIRHPEMCKGLILISSNAPVEAKSGNPPSFIFRCDFLYWFFLKLAGGSMMTMFLPKSITSSLSREEKRKIVDRVFLSSLPVSRRFEGIMFDLLISNPSVNSGISFGDISSPTLIINAVDDPATHIEGAYSLDREIRDSTLVTFAEGGHLLMNKENEIRKRIRDFVYQFNIEMK